MEAVTPAKQPILDDVWADWCSLLFAARRMQRYHMRREQFTAHVDLLINLLTLVSGSAVVGNVLAADPKVPAGTASWIFWAGVVIVVAQMVQFLASPKDVATRSRKLRCGFAELERDMLAIRRPQPEDLAVMRAKRFEIEKEEPPVLQVLDARCHNDQLRAQGQQELAVRIWPWQKMFSHIFDLPPRVGGRKKQPKPPTGTAQRPPEQRPDVQPRPQQA